MKKEIYLDYNEVQKVLEFNKDKLEYYDQDDRQAWSCLKNHRIYLDTIELLKYHQPSEIIYNCEIPFFHFDEDRAYGVNKKEIRITVIKEIIPTKEIYGYGYSLEGEDVANITFKAKYKIVTKDIESIDELKECFV